MTWQEEKAANGDRYRYSHMNHAATAKAFAASFSGRLEKCDISVCFLYCKWYKPHQSKPIASKILGVQLGRLQAALRLFC